MSRFSDDYDTDFANQWALWKQATQRALKGKRGRQALRELREALHALPEKRLIAGRLCRVVLDEATDRPLKGEVCLVGAYVWGQKVKAGTDPLLAFTEIKGADRTANEWELAEGYYEDEGDGWDITVSVGTEAGLRMTLATKLSWLNDEVWADCTPEERYEKALEWIDRELAST